MNCRLHERPCLECSCLIPLATWTEHHFTDDIQTRQYRCPEVILGAKWGSSADIWSVACVVSRFSRGAMQHVPTLHRSLNSSRVEIICSIRLLDHATVKTTTTLPKSWNSLASSRKQSRFLVNTAQNSLVGRVRVLTKSCLACHAYHSQWSPMLGELRHINKLRFWPLEAVLHDKYLFPKEEADAIAAFLSPMLRLFPDRRAKASDLIHHQWLEGIVVQGEIDIIRRAEEEEAARRRHAQLSITGRNESPVGKSDADAMKPVEEDTGTAEPEQAQVESAPQPAHQPPILSAPPAPSTSKPAPKP